MKIRELSDILLRPSIRLPSLILQLCHLKLFNKKGNEIFNQFSMEIREKKTQIYHLLKQEIQKNNQL